MDESAFFDPPSSLAALINDLVNNILNPLVGLIVALAVVYFLWGVMKYTGIMGEQGKREEARQMMLWGISAIAVMVGVWGLVNIVLGTLNLDLSTPQPPQFQGRP